MSREIMILIPYFGRWPEWINLFIETCKWNPEVCWLLYTDCGEPENKAENIERYGTVLSPRGWHDGTMNYPLCWLWRDGRLTNERDGQREFLYLHFMRWQSARWMNDPPAEGEAAWLQLERIVNVDWRAAASSGFCISPRGFTAAAR
ncbi:MAG: hypothetical protein JO232_22290 [Verrucomicrobia bacterium]|nr:hypothetical protein [Verrucomicrobiota bacterium]